MIWVNNFWILYLIFYGKFIVASNKFQKIAIIGGGNWGSTIASLIAEKSDRLKENRNIIMWLLEETFDGRNLTEIINNDHQNPKYLPDIVLPSSIRATSSLEDCCENADLIIFVIPYQFLNSTLSSMRKFIKPSVIAVSLIKGIYFSEEGPQSMANIIKSSLGIDNVAVLMGANVAIDVAKGQYVETTLATDKEENIKDLIDIFETNTFKIEITSDVFSTELCGALKNIVALGAGFCDGLGMGSSSKAAIIRLGLIEMQDFCSIFSKNFKQSIMLSSCGVADVIASSYGGRNSKCAAEFVHQILKGESPTWEDLEAKLIGGQKLQGVLTCDHVISCLNSMNLSRDKFKLFRKIHAISRLNAHPESLFDIWHTK